jgi:hypothetical protein
VFDIADVPFEQVSEAEKEQYVGRMKQTGSYQGYKPRSYWVRIPLAIVHRLNLINTEVTIQLVDNGVRDQIENYNGIYLYSRLSCLHQVVTYLPVHRDVTKRAHPEALRPFLPEISAFTQHNHFNVLHPLLRCVLLFLFSMALQPIYTLSGWLRSV